MTWRRADRPTDPTAPERSGEPARLRADDTFRRLPSRRGWPAIDRRVVPPVTDNARGRRP